MVIVLRFGNILFYYLQLLKIGQIMNMVNRIVELSDDRIELDPSLEAVNAETKFVEIGDHKIAYRSIGKGLPIVMVNRFRGNLDTWDPAFLDSLASDFNVITIDYSGIGLSTGVCAPDILSMANDVKDVAKALKLSRSSSLDGR